VLCDDFLVFRRLTFAGPLRKNRDSVDQVPDAHGQDAVIKRVASTISGRYPDSRISRADALRHSGKSHRHSQVLPDISPRMVAARGRLFRPSSASLSSPVPAVKVHHSVFLPVCVSISNGPNIQLLTSQENGI